MKIEIGTVCLVTNPPGYAFFDQSGCYIGQCGTVTEITSRSDFPGGLQYALTFSEGYGAYYSRPVLVPIAPAKKENKSLVKRILEKIIS